MTTPAKRIKRGDGITARYVLDVSGDAAQIHAALREADRAASFEFQIAEIEREARSILANAPAWALDEQQSLAKYEAISSTERKARYQTYAARAAVEYAEEIINRIIAVRAAMAADDTMEVGRWALRLGQLVSEARLKAKVERAAIGGQRSLNGAPAGGAGKENKTLFDVKDRDGNKKRDGDIKLAQELDRVLCASTGRKKRTTFENELAKRHRISPNGYRKMTMRGRNGLRSAGRGEELRYSDYPELRKHHRPYD